MSKKKTLYLIDGSSYIFRAFYGIRQNLSNSKGLPTNALYGFTTMRTRADESGRYRLRLAQPSGVASGGLVSAARYELRSGERLRTFSLRESDIRDGAALSGPDLRERD